MAYDPPPNGAERTITIVEDGYSRYVEQGNSWIGQTSAVISALGALNIEPMRFGFDYDLTSIEQAFVRPTKPGSPSVPAINTAVPDVPALAALILKDIGDAPTDPDLSSLLAWVKPDRPSTPRPDRPNVDVQLIDIDIADRGPIQIPVLRDLLQLGVVDFPALNIPEFQGVRPSINIDGPSDGALDFTEIEYSPALAGAIQTALGKMLQGELGLPLAVEQALFDRGRARQDRLSRKQIQEATEDLSSRGWDEPTGARAQRLREIRADNHEKVTGLNREITIRIAEIGQENINRGLSQGIAWEQVLISKTEAQNARALQVALAGREYAISRVNALIAIANLEQQAYATDAAVFKDLIAAELSKLQELEGRIRLEQLKGAVNENTIREYEAQWRGVQALADYYKTDVEAAKARGEINVQRIQAAELLLKEYATDADVYGKFLASYDADVNASLAPLRAAETISNVYSSRVQAHRTLGDIANNEFTAQLGLNRQTLELFQAALNSVETRQRGEIAAVDAILRKFAGDVGLYQADGNIAQAESASRERVTALAIEQNSSKAAIAQRTQEMALQQMLKIGEIMLEKLKSMASVLSQLTASSQSAVNLGAHLSYGSSDSTSYTYSGEL